MGILTVRISDAEKAALAKQAKSEGTTPGALVRRLIHEKPFTTSADLLAEMQSLMGDKSLTVECTWKPKSNNRVPKSTPLRSPN